MIIDIRPPHPLPGLEANVVNLLQEFVRGMPEGVAQLQVSRLPGHPELTEPYFELSPSNPKAARITGFAVSGDGIDLTIGIAARWDFRASGGNIAEQGHYPFGENWYTTGTASKWKFTSYERDGGTGESGNDYAMARYYVNRLGRFNSPDPLAGTIANPQSLNRFLYVRNDPVNWVDPLGLGPCPAGCTPIYHGPSRRPHIRGV